MKRLVITIFVLSSLIWLRHLLVPLVLDPDHDFLFALGPPYYTKLRYTNVDGRLVRHDVPEPQGSLYGRGEVSLFVYDVRHDQSRAISYREARQLRLTPINSELGKSDPGRRSNGFEVSYGRKQTCRGPGFLTQLCKSSDYDNVWLEGWTISRRVNIDLPGDLSFRFIGWIKP